MVTDQQLSWNRTVRHLMEVFVDPEIATRQARAELPEPFVLVAAQIVFYADERKPSIRLNEQVVAVADVRFKAGVIKKPGDVLRADEIDGIDRIRVGEDEDPDCGHATLIRFADSWAWSFDFRYNRHLSSLHLERANEFHATASYAAEHQLWAAFADNLFSAAELAARAVLLGSPDARFRRKGSHDSIHKRYNQFVMLGNAPSEHRDAFNKLRGLRDTARYLKGDFHIVPSTAIAMLTTVSDMIADARARIQLDGDGSNSAAAGDSRGTATDLGRGR